MPPQSLLHQAFDKHVVVTQANLVLVGLKELIRSYYLAQRLSIICVRLQICAAFIYGGVAWT